VIFVVHKRKKAMLVVAAVQMTSTETVADNLDRAERLISRAAEQGATVVGLPENFAYLRSEAEAIEYRQQPDGELVAWMRELASRLNIYLLAGSFPEAVGPEKVYNTSLLFNPKGEQIARYRKIHLFDATLTDGTVLTESRFVEPGSELVMAEVEGHKMGLSICYDLRFSELYRRLAVMGAEVIFIPSAFTMQTGKDHWEVLLRARAIENQVYIVAPAQFGQHNPRRASYGRSMIIDPWGTVVAKASDLECVITAEIDFDYLRKVHMLMPCRKHIKIL
jgi:deaminated glutathione amidase